MDTSLINGLGSIADFTAAYGDQIAANQTPYDAADNGSVTLDNGVATYNSPNWLGSLLGVVNQGTQLAADVGTVVNSFSDKPSTTSAAAATKANTAPNPAATGSATTKTSSSSTIMWIVGLAVAGLAAVLLLANK